MNKTELIEAVAQATDLSKVAAGKAVDAMLAAIGKSLQGGDSRGIDRFRHLLGAGTSGANRA
jgi:nucleoid DNA-binding protein